MNVLNSVCVCVCQWEIHVFMASAHTTVPRSMQCVADPVLSKAPWQPCYLTFRSHLAAPGETLGDAHTAAASSHCG